MMKIKYVATALTSAVIISAGSIGVVSAASLSSTKNTNVGLSGIPRTVFKQEKLNVVAEALNTTPASIKTARSNKNFKQLISNAGLTKKTFTEKVKSELTADLESKGYSQDQITIALQHKTISHLRHRK